MHRLWDAALKKIVNLFKTVNLGFPKDPRMDHFKIIDYSFYTQDGIDEDGDQKESGTQPSCSVGPGRFFRNLLWGAVGR